MRFTACCRLENAIFSPLITQPGRSLLVVPCIEKVYLLVLHHAQEEEGARGEEHAVRVRRGRRRRDRQAVAEPRYLQVE